MAVADKKALNEMTAARTQLIIRQPFFGTLALQLQLVEVQDENVISTMAVDGRNLFYHPPFVHTLSKEHLKGVIAHEVMHCALKHMLRVGNRERDIYNVAADFVINLDLVDAGFSLPGQAITMKTPPGTKGHLLDQQYRGMSTEQVYELLMQNVTKVKVFAAGADNPNDPGGCGGVQPPKAGDGKGQDDKNAQAASAAEKAQIEADWEANVRMAVAVARRTNAGSIPGHLKRMIEELNKPTINWRELLRDFIDNAMSRDYTWTRPNKRSVACGVVLPGFMRDAMQELVVVMDCSGSITNDIMKLYASEAGGALDDGVCEKMTVVYTDTRVAKVDEFLKGEQITVDAPDGGGTDFKEVMEWIPENCPDAACIVFLTDMMTNSFGHDPGIPTLWVSTTPEQGLSGTHVPFGDVIHLNPQQ